MADMLQLRGTFHAFVPWRRILATDTGGAVYGDRVAGAEFFGELAAVYTFPFASLSVYGNLYELSCPELELRGVVRPVFPCARVYEVAAGEKENAIYLRKRNITVGNEIIRCLSAF